MESVISIHTDYLLPVANTGTSSVKILCVSLRVFGLFGGFVLVWFLVFVLFWVFLKIVQ